MFIGFAVIGTITFLRHKGIYLMFYSLAGLFLLGVLVPPLARILHFIWMKLAFCIEWVVTRFIMCVIFYLIFTPLGLMMKLLGKDLLDKKIEKGRASYWKEKTKSHFKPADYEKQF